MKRFVVPFLLAIAVPVCAQTSPETSGKPARPTAAASSSSIPARLTLGEAWALAEQATPALRAADAGLRAVEGQLTDAQGLFWNNPQFSTDQARRRAPQPGAADHRFQEWAIGLSQTFELAGQHGYRRRAAELELAATREGIAEVRRQVRADVELRFSRVLGLQNRIDIERDALKLVEDVATVVKKRVAAGEDNRLEGNLAAIEAERARNALTALQEKLIEARADLATWLQLPPGSLPEASGCVEVVQAAYTLDTLLTGAGDRPLLRALDLREQAARSRLALERASTYPDITVGLATGRDGPGDARERFNMLTLSIPLPLFKRNATGIGRATTELTHAQIDRQAAERDSQARVRALWLRLGSLRERVARLSDSVLPTLNENQRLSAASYRAGEIGLLQLMVVNRQVLDARRDYLDVLADYVEARIALEQAAGGLIGKDKQ